MQRQRVVVTPGFALRQQEGKSEALGTHQVCMTRRLEPLCCSQRARGGGGHLAMQHNAECMRRWRTRSIAWRAA